MAINKGLNNSNLKSENRGLVLKMIATGEARTRIDLAKKTGLSKMSLTNIINEFIKAHIVKETEIEKVKGAGRNPVVLTITDRCKKVVGISIIRSGIYAVLTDISNNVLERTHYEITEANASEVLTVITNCIEEVTKGYERKDILGIGISAVGPLNVNTGTILNPKNLFGIENLEIVKFLEEKYGVPAFIDNMYCCAAILEKYFGVGKHYSDFIFLGLGKGVGSGVVVNDELLHSAEGNTPELGHFSIDYNGKTCACGNKGCLELYAAFDKLRIKLMFATGKDVSIEEFIQVVDVYNNRDTKPEDYKELLSANEFSEEQLVDIDLILTDASDAIAAAMTSAVNMVHSSAIILGDEGFFLPSKYLRYIEDSVNSRRAFKNMQKVNVIKSGFATEAHIIGATTLVMDAVFKGNLVI